MEEHGNGTASPAIGMLPSKEENPEKEGEMRSGLLAMGGILGAIAASSCCILPLGFFSMGIGGAWMSNLTALAPYQPIFVSITFGFLGAGFWRVYRKPKAAEGCADRSCCASPTSNRVLKIALWSATALVLAVLAFPFVAPILLY